MEQLEGTLALSQSAGSSGAEGSKRKSSQAFGELTGHSGAAGPVYTAKDGDPQGNGLDPAPSGSSQVLKAEVPGVFAAKAHAAKGGLGKAMSDPNVTAAIGGLIGALIGAAGGPIGMVVGFLIGALIGAAAAHVH